MNVEIKNEMYKELCCTVQKQCRLFFTVLRIKVLITECFLNENEKLLFWNCCWVSDSESLHINFI